MAIKQINNSRLSYHSNLSLIANAYPFDLLACLAFYEAAPVEAAVAPLVGHFLNQIVASAAAERRACVAARACAVTASSVRAFDV